MKTSRILSLLLTLISWFAVSAQNEIYVGYGAFPIGHKFSPTVSQYATGYYPLPPEFFTPERWLIHKYQDMKATSSVSVMYFRQIINRFSVGLSYTYFKNKPDDFVSLNSLGEPSVHNHTALALVKYKWLHSGRFSLYSRGGIGARFAKATFAGDDSYIAKEEHSPIIKDDSSASFAWQMSPIGAEFEILPFLSVFAEAGIGTQGCILAGLKTSF